MEDIGTLLINLLLGVGTTAIPALLAAAWKALQNQSAKIDNDLLRGLTDRTILTADAVTGAAFGRFGVLVKAAQAPESDGGEKITDAEWRQILDALWDDFKGGFGKSWLERAGQVIGIVEFEKAAKAELESKLIAKLDDKRAVNATASAARASAAKAAA